MTISASYTTPWDSILERAGRLAEQLETMERTHDAQRRMLEVAARRPRSRDELAERLRDGRF